LLSHRRAAPGSRPSGERGIGHTGCVAEVDSADDGIDRWVVQHFRFDPERRERRNVVVAAYDNSEEMQRHMSEASLELSVLQTQGVADDREHIFGGHWPAGSKARADAKRIKWNLARRGLSSSLDGDP
jgi:hypothetical protein